MLPIGTEIWYLEPGDSLYAASVTINNTISNLYDFAGFRVWSYDSEGHRGAKPIAEVESVADLLLTVPLDYSGSGFSIEPIGAYSNRTISVRTYFINNARKEQSLEGIWTVDERQFTGTTSISPVDSYVLKYNYSNYADDYYFVSSAPECWYSKDDSQTVIFQEASSHEEITQYSVLMHPFVTLTVYNKCISTIDKIPFISSGGKGIITSILKGNESLLPEDLDVDSFPLVKLRVGDVVTIKVGKEYKITGTGVNVGTAVPLGSNADNGYEYTIIVPDTNNGIQISVTKRNSDAEGKYAGYNIANADLVVTRADGSTLDVGDELPADSEKVTVKITAHDGYYLDGKGVADYRVYSDKMKFSDFQKNVSKIISDHPAVQYITIIVNTQDECGTCVYSLDGKPITGNTFVARIGQKIELKFTANSQHRIIRDGWIAEKWSSLWGSTSISDKIEVTADMNGRTINRANFGIQVEKVG